MTRRPASGTQRSAARAGGRSAGAGAGGRSSGSRSASPGRAKSGRSTAGRTGSGRGLGGSTRRPESPSGRRRSAEPTAEVPLDAEAVDGTAAGRRLTVRTGVVLAVCALVAGGLIQPLSTGLGQLQQIAALKSDIEATQGEVDALEHKREQLDDPDYVKQRAREEQQYVEPGEDAYIVIDPSEEAVASDGGADRVGQPVREQPWYIEFADSLRAVGFASEESR